MFEYYKGYEIDGSDTYYSLLTPNFEKVKEMITYVLSLKIVDKNKPITIKKANKNKRYVTKDFGRKEYFEGEELPDLVDRDYDKNNLEELFYDLFEYEVSDFRLEFVYVNIENLYPDIKREIIDMILEERGSVKKYHFKNPVLTRMWSNFDRGLNYQVGELIDCYFIPQKLKNSIFDESRTLTPIDKIEEYTKESYFNVDFCVSTVMGGVQPLLSYYVLKKLTLRFPEYEIKALETLNKISCYKLNVNDYIFESLQISPKDIEHMLSNQLISFNKTEWVNEGRTRHVNQILIDKGYLYLKQILDFEWYCDETNLNAINYRDEHPLEYKLNKLLRNYYDPTTKYISIENYIKFCEKLYELNYLASNDIRKFTTSYFLLKETVNSEMTYECKVRFNVKEGKKIFEVIVPYECREWLVNRYN